MRFVLLFMIFAIRFIECCDPKIITADMDSHSFLENSNNSCEYIIEPHPTKSIQINMGYYYRVNVWLQFQVNGVKHEIYLARLHNTDSGYQSPKNVGVRIQVEHIENSYINLYIQRIEVDKEVCKFPYIVVGINDTLIQEQEESLKKEVHCAYRLVPDVSDESFNEILLNFDKNMDYQIKRHKNGLIGELEPESHSKVFPIGVVDLTFSRSGSIPRILSRLVHISCSCGDTTFTNFSENNMMSIRSPGFPSANCIHKECEYNINYSSNTSEIFLFDIKVELGKEDQLTMNEALNNKKVIDYPKYVPTSFAFESRNFSINYRASRENIDRFFEINVTRIPISEECRCSSYLDKSYTIPGSFNFIIPKTCNNVYCHWKIGTNEENNHMNRLVVKMSMENPNPNDLISVNDEKFIGSELMQETLYSTKNVPIDVEFRRFHLTNEKDTRLSVSWSVQDCKCPTTQLVLDTKSVKALTNPNYPDNYCSDTKCSTFITAPNNTYIELKIVYLELENFHDFLRIYDEKHNAIAELTRIYKNHTIVSTGNVMSLLFESDSNRNLKGYFIHVTSKETPTEEPVTSEEKSTGSSNTMLILILTIFAVLLIAAVIGLVKFGIARKLSNGVVQFSNYPMGSNVSINISSM